MPDGCMLDRGGNGLASQAAEGMPRAINNRKSKRYRRYKHPDRFAWIERLGAYLCYECAYGRRMCEQRLGIGFYEKGGPGCADDDESR